MIDKEVLQIISATLGGLLFSLGGYRWKWLRRFVLPLIFSVIALLSGFLFWKAFCMGLGLIVAFSLGYGEKKSYFWKGLVGVCFVLPTLFLGLTYWQIITPLVWIILFKLSNWEATASTFYWKAVEFLTGALIGLTIGELL